MSICLTTLPKLNSLHLSFGVKLKYVDRAISEGTWTTSDFFSLIDEAAEACRKRFPQVTVTYHLILRSKLYTTGFFKFQSQAETAACADLPLDKRREITYNATQTNSPYSWHGMDLTVRKAGFFDKQRYLASVEHYAEFYKSPSRRREMLSRMSDDEYDDE